MEAIFKKCCEQRWRGVCLKHKHRGPERGGGPACVDPTTTILLAFLCFILLIVVRFSVDVCVRQTCVLDIYENTEHIASHIGTGRNI